MIKRGIFFLFFFGFLSCAQAQSVSKNTVVAKDSVVASISKQYSDPSFLRKIFLGSNYRKTWETPVRFPVFHLKEKGFTIKDLGGGMQTKSLRLEDKNGEEWVLRSLEKDVEKAVPEKVRGTIGQKVAQDMVSGSQPYAPLTIHRLAEAVGVVSADPVYYYIPDDPAFGDYRKQFANTVCMLEQREPTPDNSETDNTEKLVKELLEGKDHLVWQENLLKARLLDMLIADWDRHADQWRWGKKETDSGTYFYPIPRDRDQAYFESKGLLVKTAKFFLLHFLSEFKPKVTSFKALNTKAWSFDAYLLNDLDRKDWTRITTNFQNELTDDVIHEAILKMPAPIYALDGLETESILRARRDQLLKGALNYYDDQARSVSIIGSEDPELYHITGGKDSLTVMVYNLSSKYKNLVMYHRTFLPKETKLIKLMSLDGDDQFVIDKSVSSKIKFEIDGGQGNNIFDLKGNVKTEIFYSNETAKTYLEILKTYLRIGIRFI